jgi:glycosyltransferase involved in cell wall biosynthesis
VGTISNSFIASSLCFIGEAAGFTGLLMDKSNKAFSCSTKGTVLALGVYRSSGGVSKSIHAFQRALNARVISWVDRKHVAESPLIWAKSTIVQGSRFPVLKGILYPSRESLGEAEKVVRCSRFVSCHSFWRWHNLWLLKVARKAGVPYWFVPHGGLDPYVLETDRLAKRAFLALGGTRFIRSASCVIFSTRREWEKAARLCKPRRAEVVYWPLCDSDLNAVRDTTAGQHLRDRLGIGYEARCLLYFGRLHSMKRPLETIDAVAAAGRESLHLIIVGNEYGVSFEDCRQRAAKQGVGHRVHVVGPVYGKETHAYFSASDAFVSLSHRENFNLAAAESMAAGLPVLLSRGNDLGGELTGTDCGWILSDDGIAAVSAMKDFADCSQIVLEDKGNNARQWTQKELKFEAFQQHLYSLIETIVSAR